jgi:hypothetical protein
VPAEDVTEFGGWPRPSRWVWVVAGLAAVAVLAGEVVARTGPHHAAASPHAAATAPVHRWGMPAQVAFGPGACASAVHLPRGRIAHNPGAVPVRVSAGPLVCCVPPRLHAGRQPAGVIVLLPLTDSADIVPGREPPPGPMSVWGATPPGASCSPP